MSREQSNEDVQRFFTNNSEYRFENELANIDSFYLDDSDDDLLSNVKHFYLDDSDDDLVNEAYENYLTSVSNYLVNDHNYTNQVSKNVKERKHMNSLFNFMVK